ncbi:MAG: hypothetical protein JJ850_16850 [Kordiimonadaceae bacterium]|nr:hypothetical protein [Kordiimonadaceae bacterium]MBO6569760.1 hypothetical protein [Kordiimonadaceae bacterium]MBO6966295.1 hypothetical protein [Kordiimonadaceae bacterium]
MNHQPLKGPSGMSIVREALVGVDLLGLPRALFDASRTQTVAGQTKAHVMVLPGFGANDVSTAPLRYFLSKQGFQVEGWGLGINTGGRGLAKDLSELSDRWDVDRDRPNSGEVEVPALCDQMTDRVLARSKEIGAPIALVGWSLGGYIAREVARDLPEHVSTVITLGSPISGGPKYTTVAPLFRARGLDVDWIEEEIEKRKARPITQPVSVIYSKRDGVVGWQASLDHTSPRAMHHEVNCSHMGLGLNAKVWNIVLKALEEHA